jgi:hypothetical protein
MDGCVMGKHGGLKMGFPVTIEVVEELSEGALNGIVIFFTNAIHILGIRGSKDKRNSRVEAKILNFLGFKLGTLVC